MRKFLALVVALTASATSVGFAGERLPPINWAGPYIGLNGGYGWDSNHADISLFDNLGNVMGAPGIRPFGGFLGGQIGYNWQRGRLVYGVEADLQKAAITDSYSQTIDDAGDNLYVGKRISHFGTVRGRIGAVFEHYLIYGTGGFAYGSTNDRYSFSNTGFSADFSENKTRTGFVLGGGVELALAPHWSAKVEYQHVNLGSGASSAPELPDNGVVIGVVREDHVLNTLHFGLNFKFGGDETTFK